MSPGRDTDRRSKVLVGVSAAVVLAVLAAFVADIGRAYPGFFFTADYRVFPMTAAAEDAGFQYGDRLLAVDGRSPVTLMERVRASGAPVRYDVARGAERLTLTLAPAPFTWTVFAGTFAGFFLVSALMLAVGAVVHAQNPAAPPNRVFLLYMCLWAVSNVAAPESVLAFRKTSGIIVGFVSTLLSVHGWIFFLTYPVNAAREAWMREHGVARVLYACAAVAGIVAAAVFGGVQAAAPELFVTTPLYRVATGVLFALALVSFPVKIAALVGTRRRAASPLVNQQTSVLLLGIGLGLGLWLLLMLAPLTLVYRPPVDLQIGSAFVLLYPLAIAYATVRYRLFDVTVVIRRSVVYTALAALIAGAYALAIATANVLLAHADVARSPWFSAAFVFVVALVFYPVRGRLQRAVDRTFFRERYDYAGAIQALARSMASLLDLEEITHRVTSTIESVMHARNPRLAVGPPPAELVTAFGVAPGALSRYQLAADPSYAAMASGVLETYRALGAEVVVPLRFQDELRGLLVLGPKRSEAPYTADDLALLETLADQTAVAVANAAAHHQVLEYARQLERSLLIRTNLAKFVPQRVRDLIEESPEAPSLDKRETEVTVLFADITGYTRLSERMAGATLDALVERYFGAFLDEVVRHGGDVSETAGDGLMVIFHEGDHPRAAMQTARAIHRRAAELNAALAPAVEPLAMHIGVNTGPALLGATKIEGITGTRWVYTASGHTTNIAARLAAEAGGGDVILSDSTRARLGDGFAVEPLGARPLKNVDAPVALFRLR